MAQEDLTKLTGGMLCYSYVADDDATQTFKTYLLAEIGAPYRQRFREIIADLNWIVEFGRALEAEPFKADFLICSADAAI